MSCLAKTQYENERNTKLFTLHSGICLCCAKTLYLHLENQNRDLKKEDMSMISCPECGQRVSSMAGTCPHCGCRIADNVWICTECGTVCTMGQAECPKCNAPSPEHAEPEKANLHTELHEKPRKRGGRKMRGWKWILIPTTLVLLALVAAGVYQVYLQNVKEEEDREFESLMTASNPEFYRQFLMAHPDSEHCREVEARMLKLIEEKDEWEQACSTGTREAFVAFGRKYPGSARRCLCEGKLDSLDWCEAKSKDSGEAIDRYLREHPDGRFAEEAAEIKNTMARTKVSPEERTAILGRLNDFLANAIAKQDAKQAAAAMDGKMLDFCGKPDATPEQVAAFAKGKMGKNVLGLHYDIRPDAKIGKVRLADETSCYETEFTLEETLSRSDAGKTERKTYKTRARLDTQYRILSMDMKEMP